MRSGHGGGRNDLAVVSGENLVEIADKGVDDLVPRELERGRAVGMGEADAQRGLGGEAPKGPSVAT